MRAFLVGLATVLAVGIGSGAMAFQALRRQVDAVRADLPKVAEPGTYRPGQKTRLLAADGSLLTEVYRENREAVPLAQIPRWLIDATIAAEDRRFRTHTGISPRDIARAGAANLAQGRVTQGASTITQQLVRDLYLSRRRQLRRKIGEAFLAIEMERRYAKDEILELYLNEVNYGKGLYGVRTAAAAYFGKEPQHLTLAECAALAAVPQRPTSYHLFADLDGAVTRRNAVLKRMCEQGYIGADLRDAAAKAKLVVQAYAPPDWRPRRAPHYTSWAVREVAQRLGEDRLYAGGLKVWTYLDLRLQAAAVDAVAAAVRAAAKGGASEGAAVVVDPRSGALLAIVGGLNWDDSQFNRATQAKRQPGSAFKPFVYAAALDRGYRPNDRVTDAPLALPVGAGRTWRPTNYDHQYHGEVTLTEALAQSINIPAIKVLQSVGADVVVEYAHRLGVRSPLRAVPSLALGTSEVTLLELTSAYGVLAAGGFRAEPTCIRRIEDADGKVLYSDPQTTAGVLSPQTCYSLVTMMQEVMRSGTGRPAAIDSPCAGKTGTTQQERDVWFVGFTPGLACGVWLGNDDNRAMHGVSGGGDCGPAWRRIARAARTRGGPADFTYPHWVTPNDPRSSARIGAKVEISSHLARLELRVCRDSGLLATPRCPTPVTRGFEPGLEPTERCPLHEGPPTAPDDTKPTPDLPPEER